MFAVALANRPDFHVNFAETAFDKMRAFSACETIDALASLFAEALVAVGISASASGMVTGAKATAGDPFHFVNWPSDWLELYLEKDFVRNDPLPRWAMISGLPVAWSSVIQSLRPSDPGHKVYDAARARGFTEGLAVPVRSHSGALGLVTCGGDRPTLNEYEKTFVTTLSVAVFHRADALCPSDIGPDKPPMLSQREKDIILLLRQGFTDEELSQILAISIETVRSHILNARLKAGARSRTHLVGLTGAAVKG